jgi:hypothetical protein
MDAAGLGGGPLGDVELMAGGTQNVLVRFSRGGRGFVLRRPPLHKRPKSDETMRREARARYRDIVRPNRVRYIILLMRMNQDSEREGTVERVRLRPLRDLG